MNWLNWLHAERDSFGISVKWTFNLIKLFLYRRIYLIHAKYILIASNLLQTRNVYDVQVEFQKSIFRPKSKKDWAPPLISIHVKISITIKRHTCFCLVWRLTFIIIYFVPLYRILKCTIFFFQIHHTEPFVCCVFNTKQSTQNGVTLPLPCTISHTLVPYTHTHTHTCTRTKTTHLCT